MRSLRSRPQSSELRAGPCTLQKVDEKTSGQKQSYQNNKQIAIPQTITAAVLLAGAVLTSIQISSCPLAAVTFRLMLALARNDGMAPESCISVLTLTGPAARGHKFLGMLASQEELKSSL